MIRPSIDLNADLGEGSPWDFAMLARVTSANVSCGTHAGSPEAIKATLAEAGRLGVVVGAHPGWPDREGFGRVERSATADEVCRMILDQVAQLDRLAAEVGVSIRYLKPHGALYNQAMRDDPTSVAIGDGLMDAARQIQVPILGLPTAGLKTRSTSSFVSYVGEGFPDRGYRKDGSLISRKEPGAFVEAIGDVALGAVTLARRGVDSLCLHGDAEGCVSRADAVRRALETAGFELASFLTRDDAGTNRS